MSPINTKMLVRTVNVTLLLSISNNLNTYISANENTKAYVFQLHNNDTIYMEKTETVLFCTLYGDDYSLKNP